MAARRIMTSAAAVAVLALAFGAWLALPTTALGLAIPQPAPAIGSWTTYHHDDGHTGFDSTLPTAVGVNTGWVSPALDAQIYGSPLVFRGIVYAATLNNTIYALNERTGKVVWSHHLRTPASSGWSCGNVSPQGILGTPVIDPASLRIYAATFATDHMYRLEGLRLSDGFEQVNTFITTPAGDFDWTIEQERGALAIHGGNVYVPFGGRAGDCGNYHGYVFAVPTNGTPVAHYYETLGSGDGYWAAGGVVIDDSTGDILETSGNGVGVGCNQNTNGTSPFLDDAVVRLSPTLGLLNDFYPIDWRANWCQNDEDLGSATSVIINPNLIFQSGKWGTGFLINPTTMNGMNTQAYPTPGPTETADVCLGNHGDATFASFAYAAPYVYVECEGQGLVALGVNTVTPSFTDCGACGAPDWSTNLLTGDGNTYGPPIVAGGWVWAANDGGGLYAFDATTGALKYQSGGFGINRFVTLAEACGHVFVPSHTVIRDFDMTFNSPVPSCERLQPNQGSPAPSPTRPPIIQVSPAPTPTR